MLPQAEAPRSDFDELMPHASALHAPEKITMPRLIKVQQQSVVQHVVVTTDLPHGLLNSRFLEESAIAQAEAFVLLQQPQVVHDWVLEKTETEMDMGPAVGT